MQQITIRGIAPEIEQEIQQIAKFRHQSINYVIKEIIHKEFGEQGHRPRAASLRKLSGGWSQKDASDFGISIKSCEEIDENMWQ